MPAIYWEEYGPQTREIKSFLERIRSVTPDEARSFRVMYEMQNTKNAIWVYETGGDQPVALYGSTDEVWEEVSEDANHRMSGPFLILWAQIPHELPNHMLDTNMMKCIRRTCTALLVRHSISRKEYDTLTAAWRSTIGQIHTSDLAIHRKSIAATFDRTVFGRLERAMHAEPISKNIPQPWEFSARVEGWVHRLDGYRELCVIPQLFNYKITYGPAGGDTWDRSWEYESVAELMAGIGTWDGEECGGDWVRRMDINEGTTRREGYDDAEV